MPPSTAMAWWLAECFEKSVAPQDAIHRSVPEHTFFDIKQPICLGLLHDDISRAEGPFQHGYLQIAILMKFRP